MMKGKSAVFFVSLLVLAMFMAVSAASAGDAPVYGGRLKTTINSDPPSLDPIFESSEPGQIPAGHIFETAVAADAKGAIYPCVCTYTVKDKGQTVELAVRKGVKFQNNKEVTIKDVEASAVRWLANVNAAKTQVAANLKEMRVAGDKLVFTFSKPTPLALTFMSSWDRGLYIMPKNICEKYASAQVENKDLIGTGPYQFKDHQSGRFITLKKFAGYVPFETKASGLAGTKHGYADEILFYPVSDKTARITGVQTGEYHIGLGVPSNMLEVLKKDPKLKVETVDLGIMPCAMFNCKKGRATDVNLRNAILACLDMNELMLAAQGDKSLYYLNPGLMPKSSRWWTSESLGKYNKPDLKKAAEYLKASSYDGKPLVFITTKANDYFYKTALLIQQMVKPAGIKIDLQVYDNPTLQQYRTQHDKYDIFSAGLTAKLDPTLISIMDDTWCGAYASPKKSKYAAILQNEGDFKVRYKAWKDLTKVFYEELPFITYGERRVAIVARSNVHGMFTTTTKYYWNTWLDQK